MAKSTSTVGEPLFVAWRSVQRIVGVALLVIIIGGLGSLFLWVGLTDISATGVLLIGSGAFLILIAVFGARSLLGNPRYAFYEDHFEVSHAGRDNYSVPMSEIGAVRCVPYDVLGALPSKVPGSHSRRPRIVINTYMSHETQSFEIFQNPYNEELKMHLCDWLTRKLETHRRRRDLDEAQ